MRRLLTIILLPFGALYGLITAFRNHAYEQGWLKSFEFTLPVVVVGNLKVGGTGKTPMVEYITRALMKRKFQVGIISRGYKRSTKGFLLADDSASPKMIGDEPYQYYRKWGEDVAVAVGEDRAFAIPHLLYEKPDTSVIVLDDAYQHRRVRPSMLILLTEFSRPYYEDHILPAGLLRESRTYAERADAIVITKCPEKVERVSKDKMIASSQQYAPNCPVFFTTVNYGQMVSVFDKTNQSASGQGFIVVTGIANPRPMLDYVSSIGAIVKHVDFEDHHDYKKKDVQALSNYLKENVGTTLLTTEKDAVKLREFEVELGEFECYYLPIEVQFLHQENQFLDQLTKSLVLSD